MRPQRSLYQPETPTYGNKKLTLASSRSTHQSEKQCARCGSFSSLCKCDKCLTNCKSLCKECWQIFHRGPKLRAHTFVEENCFESNFIHSFLGIQDTSAQKRQAFHTTDMLKSFVNKSQFRINSLFRNCEISLESCRQQWQEVLQSVDQRFNNVIGQLKIKHLLIRTDLNQKMEGEQTEIRQLLQKVSDACSKINQCQLSIYESVNAQGAFKRQEIIIHLSQEVSNLQRQCAVTWTPNQSETDALTGKVDQIMSLATKLDSRKIQRIKERPTINFRATPKTGITQSIILTKSHPMRKSKICSFVNSERELMIEPEAKKDYRFVSPDCLVGGRLSNANPQDRSIARSGRRDKLMTNQATSSSNNISMRSISRSCRKDCRR